jgi:hypothetical protein
MNLDSFKVEDIFSKVAALNGQELRMSGLQGCKAQGLGPQRKVSRIGYEKQDRNSG